MEWISVKSSIPSNTDDALVVDDRGLMAISCYFFVKDMHVWEERDDQIGLGNVTHWMPLPEPPKDE